jgi:drug/metabolite transporter (DMT)-like permease
MGATVASVNNFFIPVVALALGVGLRHEHVSWISIAGAAVCLLGAWLIRQARIAAERRAASQVAVSAISTPP